MNRDIQLQLDRINQAAAGIEQRLTDQASLNEQSHERIEAMRQENWRLRRDLMATRYTTEDFEHARDVANRLHGNHEEAFELLQQLLTKLKALRSALAK